MSHEPITSQRASRKDEHLELAMRLHGQDRAGAFDDVSFSVRPGEIVGQRALIELALRR